MVRAATKMQALRRGSKLRRRFVQQRSAAIAIQAAMRSHRQRTRFLRQRSAAVRIQASWRRHLAQRQLRQAQVSRCVNCSGLFACRQGLKAGCT